MHTEATQVALLIDLSPDPVTIPEDTFDHERTLSGRARHGVTLHPTSVYTMESRKIQPFILASESTKPGYPRRVGDTMPTNRPPNQPEDHRLRAADADRDRLITTLQAHTAAGRLTLDEYAERVDRAVLARTHGELAALVQDLPAESTVDHMTSGRQLLITFLVALLALAVIGVAIAAFR